MKQWRRREIEMMVKQLGNLQGRPAGYVTGALVLTTGDAGDGRYFYVDEIVGQSGQSHCSRRCNGNQMHNWLSGAVWAAEQSAGEHLNPDEHNGDGRGTPCGHCGKASLELVKSREHAYGWICRNCAELRYEHLSPDELDQLAGRA